MNFPGTEKILLGVALASAAASAASFGWRGGERDRPRRSAAPRADRTAVSDAPPSDAPATLRTWSWSPPAAQSRGKDWIYDVFTPPEIFLDAAAGEFAVRAPAVGAAVDVPVNPAGLELVAVQRAPFPLQLLGYVGGAGRYVGSFENTRTGEVFLAGMGRELPALGLVIADFAVQRRPVEMADRTRSNQWAGVATIREPRTGRVTALTTTERAYTDELLAVVALADESGEAVHELRQGEEVQGAGQTYRVETLGLDPPAARIIVTSPESAAARQLDLTPRAPRATVPAAPPE